MPWYDQTGEAGMRGTLILSPEGLAFRGRRIRVFIPISDIESIAVKKQGSNFISDWMRVRYAEKRIASFAALVPLGWLPSDRDTLRMTSLILDAVRRVANELPLYDATA